MSEAVEDSSTVVWETRKPRKRKLLLRCVILISLISCWIVLTSSTAVRGFMAYPLYVHDEDASGECAYVMADGLAYWERLVAAADLYHMDRVSKIVILDEVEKSGYDFQRRRKPTRRERAQMFLEFMGIPKDKIKTIPEERSSPFGSRNEAVSFASKFSETKSVVVVTSAPHTRRSQMCFRRAMPSTCRVQIHSASIPSESWEIHSPLWLEYMKLLVYWAVR